MVNKRAYSFPINGKGGYIKIIEAVIALLLISGTLLILIRQGYFGGGNDLSARVYNDQLNILKEIQADKNLRIAILSVDDSSLEQNNGIEMNETGFPASVANKITLSTPNYLICNAKICKLQNVCELKYYKEGDVYAQSVPIAAEETQYSPRQIKLFCWNS
ncbi:MAG: hypothetical protein Q7S56_04140 [Nanoarchaeota archaeon]|nr:hypothetical protein [Nanoarchaeota archaeon]